MLNYILTQNSLTVYDGEPLTLLRHDTRWDAALDALRCDDDARLLDILRPARAITQVTSMSGAVTVVDGVVHLNGVACDDNNYAVQRIVNHLGAGLPVGPLVEFFEKLSQNPSFRVRSDLLEFLELGCLPLTVEGNFLGYKRVNADFTDIHSGTIDYTPGLRVAMDRHLVDDNPNNTCSAGLHVCSYAYLAHFHGAKTVSVAIDPRDVVSIPADYNSTKMRVCALQVVEEIATPDQQNVWGSMCVDAISGFAVESFDTDYEEDSDGDDEDDIVVNWVGYNQFGNAVA